MDIKQVLQELGLTDKEPEIYLALLKIPGAQPASIIAKKTNLNRSTVYVTLLKLAKIGLVTKTMKHGITCFFIEDPENTLNLLVEKKQKRLGEMNHIIMETLPLLTLDKEYRGNLPRIRYYEGVHGIKQIYEAVLKERKDYCFYGDLEKFYGALGNYIDDYIKKRDSMGLNVRAIMPFRKKDNIYKDVKKNVKKLYIPHKLFPIDGEIRIFGNKVSITSLRKESLIGVIIESKTIAKMFEYVFMLSWEDYVQEGIKV